MNPIAHLRSPVALLTALALLCGTLAIVLAMSTPAAAVTRHGGITLTPTSGTVAAGPTAAAAAAACPAPVAQDKPYVKGVLALVNPGDPTVSAPIAEVVPGGPLGSTPISGPLSASGTGHATLQDRLREIVPSGPLDGRYELRLFCETAGAEARAEYFSQLIDVTGENWAVADQQATNVTVTSDSDTPPAGRPFPVRADVQPATAAGTVTFLTLDENAEVVELGTKELVDGKAEITATMHETLNANFPVLAQYTPADPAAYTASSVLATFIAGPAVTPTPTGTTPTPTGTTPTPTGTTPTPTGTGTPTPTDDPTDTPAPTDTPSGTPSDTPSPTGTDTPAPTATGDSGTSGGSGGSGTSGGSGGDSGGSGTSGGSGGADTHGGNGSLASTGASAASAALGSLALCLLGAAAVIQTRRRKAGARP
ncbi:hypothetical protein OG462_27320 [Streptomyces sp. NBC_01077]|uniref:hypothetical protein n=1 Tax=Streptomyces sp. NBC_01077 TaxID=2903746 RepID=UPI00386D1543|nr:hypothetical protein OG462_27320 [Streptomyces sp. NBC_01077]